MNGQSPPPQHPLPGQPQLPRLRLDFYSSAVLMSRWDEEGRSSTYPVSVHDVVSACTRVEVSSGLLPANTLFWKQRANQAVLGIYVPARRWQVQCETADSSENQRYHLPMPPFVFLGSGTAYQIFALKKRPKVDVGQGRRNSQTRLYHAPCPNVHNNGGICQGNTSFPVCSPRTVYQALQLFMEGSLFNADLASGKCQSYPDDVRELWAELDGRKRFPLSELAPARMNFWSLI
jgi:PRTRC genetic system protein B